MDSLEDLPAPRSRRAAIAATAWVLLVSAALLGTAAFTAMPGRDADAPARWPEGTSLTAPTDAPALLVFVHPECPCVRATVRELVRVLERATWHPHTVVVVAALADVDTRVADADIDLLAEADLVPVERYVDRDERETRRFGVHTSGEVLLYDVDHRLRFAGGVTASRGHEGANDGARRLGAALSGRTSERSIFDVFGCSLDEGAQP